MQWIGYCVAIIQYEWETFYNKLLQLKHWFILVGILRVLTQCRLIRLNNPLI